MYRSESRRNRLKRRGLFQRNFANFSGVQSSVVSTLVSLVLLSSPAQSIDGVKAIPDAAKSYAQALLAESKEDESVLSKPDAFRATFFMTKARTMAPLMQTKYTAAQMGLCGIVVGIYDEGLGAAIKGPADRISKGAKDFDSMTEEEDALLKKAMGTTPLLLIGKKETTKSDSWKFFAASNLGMLNARVTLWYISPKQETLLKLLAEDIMGCVERGGEADASAMPEVATALKGFNKFVGKRLDEATMKEVGLQVEATLKAATPPKYRW